MTNRSILVVTHYQRLLDYIQPDVVHVMAQGKIIKSGDKSLASELEAKGYGWVEGRDSQYDATYVLQQDWHELPYATQFAERKKMNAGNTRI